MSYSPLLFILTVLAALLVTMGEAPRPMHGGHPNIIYTTVTGYFMQDDPATDANNFDYTKTNLGLINRTYPTDDELKGKNLTQWQHFEHYVDSLNRHSPKNIMHKVLYMGRHGQGYHNVAESFYGTPAWDAYWSKLDGNGTVTWADAHLTDVGIAQARTANAFWVQALKAAKIPPPETYYTSPLARCLATAELTFGGLELPQKRPFVPVVKELLRETLGVHTCDRRSNRTWIHSTYSNYAIERGFVEQDPLWLPDVREPEVEQVARLKKLLDDVFTHDQSTWVSFTSHSGAITAILLAIGHREFRLATGGVIPVLVRAEWVDERT